MVDRDDKLHLGSKGRDNGGPGSDDLTLIDGKLTKEQEELRALTATRPGRAVDRAIEIVGAAKGHPGDAFVLDQLAQAVYAVRDIDASGGTRSTMSSSSCRP